MVYLKAEVLEPIISSINDVLKKNNIECVVCYGIGPKRNGAFKFCYRYEQALYRRVSKLIGLRYGFAPFSTLRLINFLKKIRSRYCSFTL